MNRIPRVFIAISLLGCLLAMGCASFQKEEITPNRVEIGHNWLSPSDMIIMQGMTVTWVSVVSMTPGHTVISTDGVFQSPSLKGGEAYTFHFKEPGIYSYYIDEHKKSRGRVVVEESYSYVDY